MLHQLNLDDERFVEIVENARLKVSEYFPPWTDLNTHDPGVTLIELFAWLTEQQRFFLDQSEDAKAFFPLLGIVPKPVSAAEVLVTIEGGFSPRLIVACTPLYAEDVPFETMETVYYDGSPLTILVIQRKTVRTPFVLGYANGFPDTCFIIDTLGQAILHDGFSLTVDGEEWILVDNFHTSRPSDTHYTLNSETGEIFFGDGMHGTMPKGVVEVMWMAVTLGEGGNIAPERIKELDGLSVCQKEPAEGGAPKETVSQAVIRAQESRRQAVTARDIEQLAYETPDLQIECIRVYEDFCTPKMGEPRIANVAVKLRSGNLTDDAKNKIKRHLEPYRLVCRDFRIVAPEMVRVKLTLDLRIGAHSASFLSQAEESVRGFFAERYGGFGVMVREAEVRAFALSFGEVSEVKYCALRAYGGAKTDANGDIFLLPYMLAVLDEVVLLSTH